MYDKGKHQKTERIPAGTGAKKFYAIKIKEEAAEDGEKPEPVKKEDGIVEDENGFVTVDGQEELPFT